MLYLVLKIKRVTIPICFERINGGMIPCPLRVVVRRHIPHVSGISIGECQPYRILFGRRQKFLGIHRCRFHVV